MGEWSKEIAAMDAISKEFAHLDAQAINRVLRWANDRFCTLPDRIKSPGEK